MPRDNGGGDVCNDKEEDAAEEAEEWLVEVVVVADEVE